VRKNTVSDLKIIELRKSSDAKTAEIQERAEKGSACQLTKKYSVLVEELEVAYFALDWWPLHQSTDFVLYELYVARQFRHRGIGARILAEVERLARANGYRQIVVQARPLENYPKSKLRQWYRRNGYKWLLQHGPDAMVKLIRDQ